MSMDIRGIFDAITPENIKNIPLIATAMNIFIENIEENALLSESIRRVYTNEYNASDSDIVKESKLNLRKGLLDVYLTSLYNVLSQAQDNEIVKAKFAQSGISGTPFFQDVERIINDEYFVTNKAFKEKIGTNISIQYAYNLTKYLETAQTGNDLTLKPIKPFHFRTDGSILKEMYENIVKPLAHPLGFTYEYNQIVDQSIQDLFGVDIIYNVYSIELRNLDGRYDVYTADANDVNVKANFLGRINPMTGALFTLTEYNQNVTVFTNKVVDVFSDKVVDDRRYRTILFKDGTYLEQYTNPIEILYLEYSDFTAGRLENTIKDYTGHWSLYVDYASDYEFSYSDEISNVLMEFNATKIKENNNGAEGNKFYNLTSGEYAFKIGGDDYKLAPGIDESENVYVNNDQLRSEISSKFTINISGKSKWIDPVTVTLKDFYGNSITNTGIAPDGLGNFTTSFNTYELNGDNYTIIATTSHLLVPYTFIVSSCGLNNFNHEFYFSSVEDNNSVTPDTIRVIGKAPASKTFDLIITDSAGGSLTSTTTSNSSGVFDKTINISTLTAGKFRIDSTIYDAVGKPAQKAFYEASDLKTHDVDSPIRVGLFNYTHGAPTYSGLLVTQPVTTLTMAGIDSTDTYILKQIGELSVDDTYAESDKYLLNYMVDNGITSISNLPSSLILRGAFIEGNKYDDSNSTVLGEEETFINYGRRVYPIDTSDFIIMTSSDYVADDFFTYGLSTTGYYLYTDEISGYDYYFYTNDNFYLTTYGDSV